MPKIENEELVRIHLHIFKSDLDELRILYENNLGYNKVVRHIIRKWLNGLKAKSGGKAVVLEKDLELDA